jgi:SAM-dependent methyltransferase
VPADESLAELYSARFDADEQESKNRIWRLLCRNFFQRFVAPSDAVLDLGAGYCEFINNIECARKIAVDLNEDTRAHAASDVEVHQASLLDLSSVASGSLDVVFCSNVYEHLHSKDDLLQSLREVNRVLRPGGRFLILQPNIRYAYREYWDFYDHHLPLSHVSMAEGLQLAGFEIELSKARFLPYSTKSRFPRADFLILVYLRLGLLQALLGKQMFIVARKARAGRIAAA